MLILDDIGNHLDSGIRALQLPGKITIGVLPHTPNAVTLATMAPKAGKEVLLHTPMSNAANKRLGPGALTSDMPRNTFIQSLDESLDSTPNVKGVSNHMGSELTAKREQMQWLMQNLAARGLYFVDSRTSAATVAAAVATEYRVPHLSRRIFLDNEQDEASIERQFEALLRLARKEGYAVAIGHPYAVTLQFLERRLPEVAAEGFELVLPSEVLARLTASPDLR